LNDQREIPFDPVIAGCAATLVIIGLVMVGSASMEVSARLYDNAFHLLARHLIYVAVAAIACVFALMTPVAFWQRGDRVWLVGTFVLLGLLLVPGIGREVNGSVRWIPLGPFSFQPSEFAKFFVVTYLAGYLIRHDESVRSTWGGFVRPLGVVTVFVILLLLEPDFGTAAVLMATVMGMIFLVNVPLARLLPVVALAASVMAVVAVWKPYRLERLTSFTNPWADQFDSGYQLTQALIAFGRGEMLGTGLGNSMQKQFFLPEAHTDFLFSIIAEELGAVGALILVALFTLLVLRCLSLGKTLIAAEMPFHGYLAYGIALLIGIQALINIGVNIGRLPTKGLTLPLISFGGNSLIVSCLMIGVLIRIEYEYRTRPMAALRRRQ
jgi:cell division protein FtsW